MSAGGKNRKKRRSEKASQYWERGQGFSHPGTGKRVQGERTGMLTILFYVQYELNLSVGYNGHVPTNGQAEVWLNGYYLFAMSRPFDFTVYSKLIFHSPIPSHCENHL